MSRFFNMTPGFDLAHRAIKSVYMLEGFFDYPGPCFVGPANQDFLMRAVRPHKWTLLHGFLLDMESESIEEELHVVEASEDVQFLSDYLRINGGGIPVWLNQDEVDDHLEELIGLLRSAARVTADAAFQLLFRDVEFLFRFEKEVQAALKESDTTIAAQWLTAEGCVPRPTYIPVWLKKAIFHRDVGHCQNCGRDVTGEVYHYNEHHLDHLLPLSQGGTNDPTNFRLLCKECNLRKSGRIVEPSNQQLRFWESDGTEGGAAQGEQQEEKQS